MRRRDEDGPTSTSFSIGGGAAIVRNKGRRDSAKTSCSMARYVAVGHVSRDVNIIKVRVCAQANTEASPYEMMRVFFSFGVSRVFSSVLSRKCLDCTAAWALSLQKGFYLPPMLPPSLRPTSLSFQTK